MPMLGDVFGPDLLIVFFVFVISVAGIAVPLWAIIDAAMKPAAAFNAAGSSKGMWIALVAVFTFFTGLVGLVLAIVYLASVRPRVKAVMGRRY
jgi:hypothetical protein